jgi:electron transfer flavoprotein beta subunit
MKILVPIKRVIDHAVRVRVEAGAVVRCGVRMVINPYDANALEAALRLREGGEAAEVVAVSLGPEKAAEQLREALAMGADRAVLLRHDGAADAAGVARALAALARREGAGLILTGKLDTDEDAGAVGPMLAGLLGWAQGTGASALTLADGAARVTREVEGGTVDARLALPAVVTCELNLNTPRRARLPDIIKAKKAPIEALAPADLGVDMARAVEVVEAAEPPERVGAAVPVASAQELAAIIRRALSGA